MSKKVQYVGKDKRVRGATVEGISYEATDGASVILSLPDHAAHVLIVGESGAWEYVNDTPAVSAPAPAAPQSDPKRK